MSSNMSSQYRKDMAESKRLSPSKMKLKDRQTIDPTYLGHVMKSMSKKELKMKAQLRSLDIRYQKNLGNKQFYDLAKAHKTVGFTGDGSPSKTTPHKKDSQGYDSEDGGAKSPKSPKSPKVKHSTTKGLSLDIKINV